MRSGCLAAAAAASAALLLAPGAQALGVHSALRSQEFSAGSFGNHLPVVHVQRDFFENLTGDANVSLPRLGESDETNFTMRSLYSAPVCAGQGWFVEKGRAPTGYCRYKNGKIEGSIEGKWHGEFDEYALEKIMLGKWFESPARCPDHFESYCQEHADLVVVPSPFVSAALQQGWKWKTIWSLDRDAFLSYWSQVQARYFRNGRAPLVVVHTPYCWARAEFLRTLMEQPASFVSRVVIAGIESNLQRPERKLFGESWSASALEQLRQRAKRRADPATADAQPDGKPMLFALPYPTSVLSAARFAEDDWKAAYYAKSKRKVQVSFTGNLSKSSSKNWVRSLVHTKITSMGGESARIMVNTSILCPGYNASFPKHCGIGGGMTMWDVAAESEFCLEPPGDTPTRSHFYIAVQSGCVPVLFNGGHTSYQEDEPAWFAWRGDTRPKLLPGEKPTLPQTIEYLFQDPSKMAIVFNSTQLLDDETNDVMDFLLDLPITSPRRMMHLRRNLDAAAPLMTFSVEMPSIWLPECSQNSPADAFEAFQGIMLWESWQRPGGTKAPWCS